MAHPQSDPSTRIINDRQGKLQWGVPQSERLHSERTPIQEAVLNSGLQPSNQSPPAKGQANANIINFQDLPIKQSEIITSTQRHRLLDYHHGSKLRNQSREILDKSKGARKLNQLKSEFEILRGMIIDSKILQQNRNYDGASNHSKSNRGSAINHTKTGLAVRAKDKISRKSMLSSSSLSQKDFIGKNSQFQPKTAGIQPSNKARLGIGSQREDQIERSKHSNKKSDRISEKQRGHSKSIPIPTQIGFGNTFLDRHPLQIQLKNALQKIQMLLQNQILLKARNYQLQEQLKKSQKIPNAQEAARVEELSQKIRGYEKQIEQYRTENRQLIQVKATLQADLVESGSLLQIIRAGKEKQQGQIATYKLRCADLQIENRRLSMQKDIEIKHLLEQIERLKLEKRHYMETEQAKALPVKEETWNFDKERIKILEQELQEKDAKHKRALDQLQRNNTARDHSQLLELIENLHKKRKAESQGQSDLGKQLANLKEQLIRIRRSADLSQSQFGFESKVISLEHALRRDEEEKQKYIAQMEHFQMQYQELKAKYRDCELQLQQQTEKCLRATSKLKIETDQVGELKQKLQQSLRQNEKLSSKVEELQSALKDFQHICDQMEDLKSLLKRQGDTHNLEIKEAKRKIDLASFDAFKAVQESKIQADLQKRQFLSEISVLNGQTRALETELSHCRDLISKLKYENQCQVIKINDLEFEKEPRITIEGHLKIQQKSLLRRQYEQQMSETHKLFVAEQGKLTEKIAVLTNINQQMSQDLRRVTFLEQQNNELRALCRRKVASDSAILHLWDIKQVQYSGINSILKHLKVSGNVDNLEQPLQHQSATMIPLSISTPSQLHPQHVLGAQAHSRVILTPHSNETTQWLAPANLDPVISEEGAS